MVLDLILGEENVFAEAGCPFDFKMNFLPSKRRYQIVRFVTPNISHGKPLDFK